MKSRPAPNESTIATHGTRSWSLTDLHRGATRPRVDVGIHLEAAT